MGKFLTLACLLLLLPYIVTPFYRWLPPLSLPVVGEWVTGRPVSWRLVPLAQISHALPRSVMAAEDAQFCRHAGVDWTAVEKTLVRAEARGRITHGASTLTMQTAKNLFYWYLPSIFRKPLEVPLAYWMDFMLGKRRLMEIYLNIAEFGPGIYGAEAASRRYFGKRAAELTADEAARLTAVLPNPKGRNPARPSSYVAGYAASIRARAARMGGYVECLR